MKIAISNIAWQISEEASIATLMQELNIKGVEIAPTKVWNTPLSAKDSEISEYRNFWQIRGIQIVAMQSLIFGRPDLTIFESAEKRKETFEYLSGMTELGSKLGVQNLVFGSPKNRRVENLDQKEAEEIATSFFYDIGQVAHQNGVMFCIEPNPAVYNCDFITTSKQALDLVERVNSNGFGLHLDAAGITLSGENIETAINLSGKKLCHFHISEPHLEPVGAGIVDHPLFAKSLDNQKYKGWKSIEMKAQSQNSNILNVTKALKTAIKYYS
ncbi:sugar phosphate isomerase/epimerase [Coleofasciculus sp. FACHB-T130]|nr:sugar phosphate isomerase/epimerase [Coleofasciculus sp. FACHB-T130]